MKMTYIRTVKLALGILAALALPSCLQNETTLTLNKDGSGTIVEETYLGAKMLEMMTQFAQPGQPDPVKEMFSEDKAKEKAKKMGEGVEYVKTEIINKDGKKGALVHYKFADINKVNVSPTGAVDGLNEQEGDPEEDEDEKDTVSFTYADGKLKVKTPPSDFDKMNMGDDENAQNPEMEAMMKEMMADMSLTMKLKIADGIGSTNATYTEGDTITLFDVQFGKMLEQKAELKKISKTAKTDKEAAKAAFAKLDGMKMEMNEDLTVTIK